VVEEEEEKEEEEKKRRRRLGLSIALPLSSGAKVNKRVQLYHSSPSGSLCYKQR
jgi:hypothetical protein